MKSDSMFGEPKALYKRGTHRGLHGLVHIDRERRIALLMIVSGLLRVAIWALLIVLYVAHVSFVRNLYGSVSFVALLSVLALLLTDWGQVAASLAQFTAGHAHHDIELARKAVSIDTIAIAHDLEKLAKLSPGVEGDRLAKEISEQLVV